jgi:predicted P-loop ATPase
LGGEWYTDDIETLGTKDASMQVGNARIVELSELDSIRNAAWSATKGFISRKVDQFRPPYGRNVVKQERQSVMCGTVNPEEDLSTFADPTGNVRFWPVKCTKIDLVGLRRDRDQLWAEAVARYEAGEQWWLDDDDQIAAARREQEKRAPPDNWADIIRRYLAVRPTIVQITPSESLSNVLNIKEQAQTKSDLSRVGIAMKRKLKWKFGRDMDRRWYERPPLSLDEEFKNMWGVGAVNDPGGLLDNL